MTTTTTDAATERAVVEIVNTRRLSGLARFADILDVPTIRSTALHDGGLSGGEWRNEVDWPAVRLALVARMDDDETPPKWCHVSARRWWSAGGGATYHSVVVYVDGEAVAVDPFEWGYGRHYLETAGGLVAELGIIPALRYPENDQRMGIVRACESLGVKFTDDCADVSRRKDLHRMGKGGPVEL